MDVLQYIIRKVTRKPAAPRLTMDTESAPWSTFGELRPLHFSVLPQPLHQPLHQPLVQKPIMYHHHPQLHPQLHPQPLLQQWHWQQPPQYNCHYYPRQPICVCPLTPSCA